MHPLVAGPPAFASADESTIGVARVGVELTSRLDVSFVMTLGPLKESQSLI